ncbi:Cytochrome P450 82C4 [Acorus gramineus]|uniref:Cytochrome P450 82C4 n=1 Tax=Acorus gramineus TaxID=55184 RepID=A0AAV9AWI2_ACOGR|nr:Cytochrome P450 82C4 [Acorus gramineus]
MDLPLPLQALLACLLPLILIYYYSCNSKSNTMNNHHHKSPPEPSGAWPIIGHLPLLSRPGPLCRTLAALADEHGPIFSLRLGARRTVVVSGLAEAKECFSSNDRALAGRPDSAASRIMGYDCAMIGLSPYGPYWREVRKIAIVKLLSNARLDALAHVRRAEVDESVKALRALCAEGGRTSSATVEMKRWLGELTFNALVKMVVGRRCFDSTRNGDADVPGRFRKAAADLFVLFGVFVPSDVLPIFKWADLKGYKAAMRRTANEMDALLVGWLKEHRKRRAGSGEVEGDFMDVMLSIIDKDKAEFSTYDPDTIIKATSLNNHHHKTQPEPSGAWPIIGHLPLLSRPGPLCCTLAALGDEHGPVFSLCLGARRTVVVSGLAEAKECFTSNDRALTGRPDSAASRIMGHDCAMIGFSPYGPYWREVNKIVIDELHSNARLDALAHVRRAEVDESIKALRARCAQGGANSLATVEMKRWLGELMFNAVVKMVAGRRCFESTRNGDAYVLGRFRKAAADWFVLFGEFVPSDVLPIFKWVDFKGYKAAMRRMAEEIDTVLVRSLKEHQNHRAGGGKRAIQLINHCRVLKKAQEELDIHVVSPDRNVAWPIIGHLPLLSRPGPLCRTLAALADKHGPIFSLHLGARCTVVVSGLPEAKECFTSNDRALAGRTDSAASRIMAYDYAVLGFSTYGPYWREIRKIAIIELLSNARLDALAHVQRGEVDESVKALRARCAEGGGTSATVEMREWFGELTFNSVVKMVAGRQCLESTRNDKGDLPGRFRKATTDFFMLFGMLVPSDMVPVFKWVDWKGYKAAMRRTAEEIDAVLVRWLEDHRRRRSGGDEVEGDFMDVMLSIIDKAELSRYDPDTIIKATCLALVLGGIDTTTITLTWAITLLVNDCRGLSPPTK